MMGLTSNGHISNSSSAIGQPATSYSVKHDSNMNVADHLSANGNPLSANNSSSVNGVAALQQKDQ